MVSLLRDIAKLEPAEWALLACVCMVVVVLAVVVIAGAFIFGKALLH